jgi:hypothetical protein
MKANGRLHLPRNKPQYPLDRGLDRLQNRFERCGQQKYIFSLLGIKPVTRPYTDWAIPTSNIIMQCNLSTKEQTLTDCFNNNSGVHMPMENSDIYT